MSAAVVFALIAMTVAAGLALALLRAHTRLRELDRLRRIGPLTLSRDLGDNPAARAIHEGWAAMCQQMIYSANDEFWETDALHHYKRVLQRDQDQPTPNLDALIGQAPWEAPTVGVTPQGRESLKSAMEQQRPFHEFVSGRIDSEGVLRYSCSSGVPVFTDNGDFAGYRGASRDYTEIRQTQVQLEIRDAVTSILAGAARLSEALPSILEAVAKPLGWCYGARWMRDTRNNTLLCGETWAQPNALLLADAARARRFPIGPHDMISRAWTTQTLQALPDIAQDLDFNRREQALASDLHAAFAFPVVVQGEVVCVLEFVGARVQKADALIELLARSLGSQLALFWLRREAEARLTYAATHDALTGLRNRLSFNAELDRAIQRAKRNRWRLGLMFIDLDGFKQVNDRLGHAAGDTLLIEIAKRLKNSLRSSDTLARMGGDEFVVLLEQTGTDGEIAEVAQKLLTVIQAPFEAFGGERLVSASFGVAIYPVDAQDQQGLLTHADSAMYRAKASAENHVVFYRPPASEVPALNRSLDVSAVIEAVASSMPSTDAPLR